MCVLAGFKCGLQHGGDTDDDDDHPPRSGGAGPAVATGTTVGQPKIAFQGWLKKRGKRNKRSWRVRWFVLYSGAPAGVLSYYTDKDCKRKKGSITLEEAFVYQVDPTEDGQVGLAALVFRVRCLSDADCFVLTTGFRVQYCHGYSTVGDFCRERGLSEAVARRS